MKVHVHFIDVTDFKLPDGTVSSDWLRGSLDILGVADRIKLTVYDGVTGAFPDPEEVCEDGNCVMISGSSGDVFDNKHWILPLLDFIRSAHKRDTWILGICFGHQALAASLGGKVALNPRGLEMGSLPVYLTQDGENSELFKGVESGGLMNLTHKWHVAQPPEGSLLLAFNDMTPVQAFSIGKAYGIQPHPEMNADQLNQLARMLKDKLARNNDYIKRKKEFETIISSIRETPEARAVLRNFIDMVEA